MQQHADCIATRSKLSCFKGAILGFTGHGSANFRTVQSVLIEPGLITFDSGLVVEPPLLLAIPFAVLTVASVLSGAGSLSRGVGSVLLVGITTFCVLRGLRRKRIRVRPASQEISVAGRLVRLTGGVRLAVSQTEVGPAGAFELTLEDRNFRQVLLSSSLPQVLNALEKARQAWAVPCVIQLKSCPDFTFDQVANRDWSAGLPNEVELTTAVINRQKGHAGILAAVAVVAGIVVAVLIRQQIHSGHPISLLGWFLCALLVLTPALMAAHLLLSRVRLRANASQLNIEHRRGLLGVRRQSVIKRHLLGLWAVRCEGARFSELIWRDNGGFRSVPLAEGDLEHWQTRLNLSA